MPKKQEMEIFNARDKAIQNGVPIQYYLTDGGIEDYVERFGFQKTLEHIKI